MINCDEYEIYLKQHLPRRILVQLNKEFQIMAEHAKERLSEIAREESLATLTRFLQEKGLNSGASLEPGLDAPDHMVPFSFELLNDDGGIDFFGDAVTSWPLNPEPSI